MNKMTIFLAGSDSGRNVRGGTSARLSASIYSQRSSSQWNRCNFTLRGVRQHRGELDLPAMLHRTLRSQHQSTRDATRRGMRASHHAQFQRHLRLVLWLRSLY